MSLRVRLPTPRSLCDSLATTMLKGTGSNSWTNARCGPAHGAACVYACSTAPGDNYDALAAEVNKEYANTKIIGYPFGLKEEDTLTLIDDVLNSWGRYVSLPPLPPLSIAHSLALPRCSVD